MSPIFFITTLSSQLNKFSSALVGELHVTQDKNSFNNGVDSTEGDIAARDQGEGERVVS